MLQPPYPLTVKAGPPRFVILHYGALGDFILALPAAEGLNRLYPEARIDFWGRGEYLELISNQPWYGSGFSAEGPELLPFFHETLWMEAEPPEAMRSASAVFVFGQESRRAMAERLSQRLSAPVHWIRSFPEPGLVQPVSEFILDQMRALGFPIGPVCPRIEPFTEEKAKVREWMEREYGRPAPGPIVIHPGSGGRKKIWPLPRWRDLLCRLGDRNLPIVLTLGPADDRLREFAEEARRPGARVLNELTLPRLAALLGEARLYMGCDSGVSHLAAAAGAPSIVIFGPTSPEVWGPRGSNVRIVRDEWREDSGGPSASILQALDAAWLALLPKMTSPFA